MNKYDTKHFDNRDAGEMYVYLEARIDVLKRRISELERENEVLRINVHGTDGFAIEDRRSCCAPSLGYTLTMANANCES
jgi:hypothetical protein